MSRPLKRIYYVPGILTLAIAPILFVVKTNKYIADRTEHCISIIVGRENEKGIVSLFPKLNYLVYQLNGQINHDSLTLIMIENFAKGINQSKNSSVGIKVLLDKQIKYKTYIDLLNSCLRSGITNWIPLGDTVFLYYRTPPKDYNTDFIQNFLVSDVGMGQDCCFEVSKPKPEPTMIQKIKNHAFEIKLAVPFMILYLILVYLTIRKIKNEG